MNSHTIFSPGPDSPYSYQESRLLALDSMLPPFDAQDTEAQAMAYNEPTEAQGPSGRPLAVCLASLSFGFLLSGIPDAPDHVHWWDAVNWWVVWAFGSVAIISAIMHLTGWPDPLPGLVGEEPE